MDNPESPGSRSLPLPDCNRDRPCPPVDGQPTWVVPCPNLDEAMDRLGSAGFSLLAIGPADDPRWALMSHGHEPYAATLRLDTTAHAAGRSGPYLDLDGPDGDEAQPRPDPGDKGEPAEWVVGRAGMRYRDLLPGRWDGQFIASHIHVPVGGPVPDYVHYHHIEFQLIFCYQGWVRLVYQDQGDPFVLHPCDAILQAPGIRHRVLEASDDLHVIEVSSPADHATFVEYDLELPNGVEPDKWYGGQRYVHHRSDQTGWEARDRGGRAQSLGLEGATNGRYGASLIELEADSHAMPLPGFDSTDFEFIAVLAGSLEVADPTSGESATFGPGSALALDDRCSRTSRPLLATRLLSVRRYRT